MLFNEPKLLKLPRSIARAFSTAYFSALQRAEIAEIVRRVGRAGARRFHFSALQRAEIAEMAAKRLKQPYRDLDFSALQRAEIAEISRSPPSAGMIRTFQCSSTSRNC